MTDRVVLHLEIERCIDCPYSANIIGALYTCTCALSGRPGRLFDAEDGIPEWCWLRLRSDSMEEEQ